MKELRLKAKKNSICLFFPLCETQLMHNAISVPAASSSQH